MAVIVLAMSVMPCADDANAMIKVKTEFKQASHQQDNPKNDACSPFCQCSCCVGFTISHFPSSFPLISFTVKKQISSFLPSEVIDITLPVWQPPQLV
ncbi:MAG: hypothetical protein KGM16_16745 [Bacteroidota bacterium]|nr:hypothetical protein [Bacteroidota bacterium]